MTLPGEWIVPPLRVTVISEVPPAGNSQIVGTAALVSP
jgi:hypothetical protein